MLLSNFAACCLYPLEHFIHSFENIHLFCMPDTTRFQGYNKVARKKKSEWAALHWTASTPERRAPGGDSVCFRVTTGKKARSVVPNLLFSERKGSWGGWGGQRVLKFLSKLLSQGWSQESQQVSSCWLLWVEEIRDDTAPHQIYDNSRWW